ncbi:hypothetical protein [Nocardioides panacisoli]|uniref:Tat pathway signal sequence domain protein n=1 Tax=Nocardioides panacisoli TaxID=627624 RepID=A0ABP7J7X7_9ACTN
MRTLTTGLAALTCLATASIGAVVTGAASTASAPTASTPATTVSRAMPSPSDFAHPKANPWFPLRPGTVWRLHGVEEGQHFNQRTAVTHRHKKVAGVRVTIVRDVIRRRDGSIAELTHDWYAATDTGAVWYFGEATATYGRDGHLIDREGSWRAGVHGAVAGLIMPAHPHVTDAFRQEYERGVAEDQAWIVERGARVRTPAVDTGRGLRSLEWARLEPGVVSQKLYVRGYGIVSERDLGGGHETYELLSVKRP